MPLITIDVLVEPRGKVYTALLAFMHRRAASFSLVWNHEEVDEAAPARAIRDRLAPCLRRTEWTGEWPGTTLLQSRATVRHYAITSETIRLLAEAPGLYAWMFPQRPEDLAFYRPDGQLLLGSIAHERDAWLEPSAVSYDEIRVALPDLVLETTTAESRDARSGVQ